jgi:uncharacterized protein (TIGR04141 family)
MGKPFSSLSLYRLRDQVNSSTTEKYVHFIEPKKKTTAYDLRGSYDFGARLFVAPPEVGPPSWLEPLKAGFGELKQIPNSVSNSAVLIIEVKRSKRALHFAATFGAGRFLLKSGTFERNYGLRVAINTIYPKRKSGHDLSLDRIRSVDSRKVSANVLRTRRQVDRIADFESFEIDTQQDLLSGLTGIPSDTAAWGKRIDGSDAIHLHFPVPFDQLGKVCLEAERKAGGIPDEFSWIDNIFPVRDSHIIEGLKLRVLNMIKSKNVGNLELAPPELIEWGEIDHFQFSFDSPHGDAQPASANSAFAEPSLAEYIFRLEVKNKLASLTLNQLTSSHRLLAINADGEEAGAWPVFRALSGELEHHSPTYVLSDGEFFDVKPGYMAPLDNAINKLPVFAGKLPASQRGWSEDHYNKEAAKQKGIFLLDKMTVRLTSRTTPIEICDLLTSGGSLIHVKRKLNSSSLSHLFSQGLVSADLILMSEEFRKKVHQRIRSLEHQRAAANSFSRLFPAGKGISPSAFTVVYAIIARWKQKSLSEALPFFSKVNLRRCAQDLKRMGYAVAYSQIPEAAKSAKQAPGSASGKRPLGRASKPSMPAQQKKHDHLVS